MPHLVQRTRRVASCFLIFTKALALHARERAVDATALKVLWWQGIQRLYKPTDSRAQDKDRIMTTASCARIPPSLGPGRPWPSAYSCRREGLPRPLAIIFGDTWEHQGACLLPPV
jgi:hypothetical protein